MKYKIIRDDFLGYEVRVRRWYWPFWTQPGNCGTSVNTFHTVERARAFALAVGRGEVERGSRVVERGTA